MKKNQILQVGKVTTRADALSKVRGEEKYAADYYSRDMLWAGVKRAGVPHARIRAIHVDGARKLAGVHGVFTHRDIGGSNRQGVIRKDQPVLADQKIRHCGDGVALVVAEDRETLARALDLISLELESLPGIFGLQEALKQGAPLVHEDNPQGNILLKGRLATGKTAMAFHECDVVIEADFELPRQEHAYLETETGWAFLHEDGILEIVASTQTPFRDRVEVAEAIGLDMEKIRIIAPYCGGAFGGKDGITVQSLLALAAVKCPGKPVKMWWDREESFLAGVKRHPAQIHYRAGATADGTLHALEVGIYFDTGPYDHLGGAVMALGLEHSGGPYRIPNTDLRAWAVYTNNPVSGAFRAFGVAQATAAMEQVMDMLAGKLGISPLELRLKNAVRRGDKNSSGSVLTGSTGIVECLEILKEHPLWKGRRSWRSSAPPFKCRGAGIASVMHGMGYGPVVPDVANAKIELTEEGKFRIFCGVVDMGQGNASTYLQIAGDVLRQDSRQMELVLPDTAMGLPSGSSSASRTTYTFGNALVRASLRLKRRLLERAADLLMVANPDEMALIPGILRHLPSGKEISLKKMSRFLDHSERVAADRFRAPVAGDMPTDDPDLRLHGIPHAIFSYGAHLALVEVDELTGMVEVKRYLVVTDCGRVINPQLLEQQMHGGVAQGLGYALSEEMSVEGGRIITQDLATYIIPGARDVPDMEFIPVELNEDTGPYGLKGAGEIATDGPLPAVANAVADACGVRLSRFPITAERVMVALNKVDDRR